VHKENTVQHDHDCQCVAGAPLEARAGNMQVLARWSCIVTYRKATLMLAIKRCAADANQKYLGVVLIQMQTVTRLG